MAERCFILVFQWTYHLVKISIAPVKSVAMMAEKKHDYQGYGVDCLRSILFGLDKRFDHEFHARHVHSHHREHVKRDLTGRRSWQLQKSSVQSTKHADGHRAFPEPTSLQGPVGRTFTKGSMWMRSRTYRLYGTC